MKEYAMMLEENAVICQGTYLETKNNMCQTSLRLSDNTTFSEIYHFVNEIKKIYAKAREIKDKRNPMELSISVTVYEGTGKNMRIISRDRWVSVPMEKQEKEGIYLKLDTRDTAENQDMSEENRDMFLFEDILNDIACVID